MSDVRSQHMSSGEIAEVGSGLFFKILKAPKTLDIEAIRKDGTRFTASSVPAGYTIGPLPETRRVTRLRITSAQEQDIQYVIGDDPVDVKEFEVALTEAVHNGAGKVKHSRWTSLTNGTLQRGIGTGLLRENVVIRGMLLKAPSANLALIAVLDQSLSVQSSGFPIEPGESQWFPFGGGAVDPTMYMLAANATDDLYVALFYSIIQN